MTWHDMNEWNEKNMNMKYEYEYDYDYDYDDDDDDDDDEWMMIKKGSLISLKLCTLKVHAK